MTTTHKRMRTLLAVLAAALAGIPTASAAAVVELPLALDYRIVEQALADQLFTGPGHTAEVFADRNRCNRLELAAPSVDADADGRLRLLTTMRARTGTPLGSRCWFAKRWTGVVETMQSVQADPQASTLTFRVVDSTLLSAEDGSAALPGFMQRWINAYVHPRLAAVRIDLQPAISGIQDLLDLAIATRDPGRPGRLSPLRLVDARPTADRLLAILSLEVPEPPAHAEPHAEAPLSDAELAAWDAAWQSWDAFATWLIKSLAAPAGPELTRALAETLLAARYDLRDALARDERQHDPVRALFLQTWDRLAPLVREAQLAVPGAEALPYAVFVSAGDALQTVDRLAPHLGLRLDRDALRRLARVLAPDVEEERLQYDTAVDPALRALLGLDPGFDDDSDRRPGGGIPWLGWLISDAEAAQIRPELLRQLTGWVPERREIDRYLGVVDQLLDDIARAERGRDKVPTRHFALYDALLRATAWQESCWRQYVVRDGAVETIRSAAGSVGLMQVNLNVWRGVYDPHELLTNVGYNTRAGNEILVHYLVDYALRKGEHEISDDTDSLARAAYAAYNGGPGHLARYRKPGTPATLKKIDNAFLDKYRAIQSEGASAVKRCLVG